MRRISVTVFLMSTVFTLCLFAQADQKMLVTDGGSRLHLRVLNRSTPSEPSFATAPLVAPAAAGTQFAGLVRFSAETQQWVGMPDNVAYFRDYYVGIEVSLIATHDGQSWSATLTGPGFSRSSWPIIYQQTVGDQHDCFSSFGMPTLCGSTVLYLQTYTDSQCGNPGLWTWTYNEDSALALTKEFTMKSEVGPEQKMQLYNQGDYWGYSYDSICKKRDPITGKIEALAHCIPPDNLPWNDPVYTPYSIQNKGCFLTSAAMLLTYHGVDVDAPKLNSWLRDHHGYDPGGSVYPRKIAEYARVVGNIDLEYKLARKANELRTFLCRYGPQLIQTKYFDPTDHWGTVYKMDNNEKNAHMYDSNGGHITDYAGTYHGTNLGGEEMRPYGPADTSFPQPQGFVYIGVNSPATLMLTNTAGQRTGLDNQTSAVVSDIPYSAYEVRGDFDSANPDAVDPDPPKRIEVGNPGDGEYALDVTGTADGTYTLWFTSFDASDNAQDSIYPDLPISAGETQHFRFSYSAASGLGGTISGSFDGGGQRPRDVNRFLSYARPSDSTTDLPSGTTSHRIVVFYGSTVLASTFKADLNGNNVASLFHPAAGTAEVVALPLQPGSNVLKLSIDGQAGSRTATDADRLVFKVQ